MCSGLAIPTLKDMCISGLFHSVLLLYSHSDFTAIVELPEGRHEYKFFVDGQWLHDPNEVQYIHVHVQMYKCVDTCTLYSVTGMGRSIVLSI